MGKGDPKGGRPEFVLSPEEYEKLVAMIRIQCTQEEICGIYGVDHKTLNKAIRAHGGDGFSQLYKKHSDEGKASLRRSQWKAAQDGNPTMLVWLGKQMLGQRDKLAIGGDKDMDPIKTEEVGGAAEKLATFLAGIAERSGTTGDPAA